MQERGKNPESSTFLENFHDSWDTSWQQRVQGAHVCWWIYGVETAAARNFMEIWPVPMSEGQPKTVHILLHSTAMLFVFFMNTQHAHWKIRNNFTNSLSWLLLIL